jgi:hypothetical protein
MIDCLQRLFEVKTFLLLKNGADSVEVITTVFLFALHISPKEDSKLQNLIGCELHSTWAFHDNRREWLRRVSSMSNDFTNDLLGIVLEERSCIVTENTEQASRVVIRFLDFLTQLGPALNVEQCEERSFESSNGIEIEDSDSIVARKIDKG